MVRGSRQGRKGPPASKTVQRLRWGVPHLDSTLIIWTGFLAFVLVVVAFSLLGTGLFGGSGTGTSIAEAAPDITLVTVGGEYQLSDQRGKVVVLYFSLPG